MAGTALLALTRCGGAGCPARGRGARSGAAPRGSGGRGCSPRPTRLPPPRGRSIAQRGTGAGRSPGAAGAACRHEGGACRTGRGPSCPILHSFFDFATDSCLARREIRSIGPKSRMAGTGDQAKRRRRRYAVSQSRKNCAESGPAPPVSPPSGERAVGGGPLPQNQDPTPPRAPDPPSGARPLPYSASPNRPQVNRKSSDLGEPPTCARMSPWARRSTAKADPGSAGASRMAA